MQRAVTALLGPTNTGKTHLAIARMLGHASGMVGFPLRLLARENYDRVAALRGRESVALVTGEERIVPERPAYWMCTVEAMPTDLRTDFLAVDEVQRPADGIYAVALRRLDQAGEVVRLGAASLGVRPQFDAGRSFEVYVMDFDEDWYGARVRVAMVERIRGEAKFESVDALVDRIRQDVVECRSALAAADRELWRWI